MIRQEMKKISLQESKEFQDALDVPYFKIIKPVSSFQSEEKVFDVSHGGHQFRIKFSDNRDMFSLVFDNSEVFPDSRYGFRGQCNGFSDIFKKALILYRERLLYQVLDDFRARMRRLYKTSVSVVATEWRAEDLKRPALFGAITTLDKIPDLKIRTVLGFDFKEEKYLGRLGILDSNWNKDSKKYMITLNQVCLKINSVMEYHL